MRIACISGSNIRHAKDSSTSLKTCLLIGQIVSDVAGDGHTVDIIQLVKTNPQPCDGCGKCLHTGRCSHDDDFNGIYDRLVASDAAFIVSAHYAPIPSKLCMILEKIEELAFLPRFRNESAHCPLYKKPVGIIAHGGGTQEIIHLYEGLVLEVISNALSWPVEMNVINDPLGSCKGAIFPVAAVERSQESNFPIQTYDWHKIRKCIEPLVCAVLKNIKITR